MDLTLTLNAEILLTQAIETSGTNVSMHSRLLPSKYSRGTESETNHQSQISSAAPLLQRRLESDTANLITLDTLSTSLTLPEMRACLAGSLQPTTRWLFECSVADSTRLIYTLQTGAVAVTETRHGAMVHALAPFASDEGTHTRAALLYQALKSATTSEMASSVSTRSICHPDCPSLANCSNCGRY